MKINALQQSPFLNKHEFVSAYFPNITVVTFHPSQLHECLIPGVLLQSWINSWLKLLATSAVLCSMDFSFVNKITVLSLSVSYCCFRFVDLR